MTNDLLEMKYWLDILVKALITVVVGIVGYDYRSMKNTLSDLEKTKYNLQMQVQAVEIQMRNFQSSLDKIDKKLDRALEK
jgi:predicted  nucleic acid-binding Zn-ribbon protein